MCKVWTPEEISFLRQNINLMSDRKLARSLGCLECQVMIALRRYKIKRTYFFKRNLYKMSDEEIAATLLNV